MTILSAYGFKGAYNYYIKYECPQCGARLNIYNHKLDCSFPYQLARMKNG